MQTTDRIGPSNSVVFSLAPLAAQRRQEAATETSACLEALGTALESGGDARTNRQAISNRLAELQRCLRKEPSEIIAEHVNDPTFNFAAIAHRLQRLHKRRLRLAQQCQALQFALDERPLWELNGAFETLLENVQEACDEESQMVLTAYWTDLRD